MGASEDILLFRHDPRCNFFIAYEASLPRGPRLALKFFSSQYRECTVVTMLLCNFKRANCQQVQPLLLVPPLSEVLPSGIREGTKRQSWPILEPRCQTIL